MKKVSWHNTMVEAENQTSLFGGAIMQVHTVDGEVGICTVREVHPRVNKNEEMFNKLIQTIENSGKN